MDNSAVQFIDSNLQLTWTLIVNCFVNCIQCPYAIYVSNIRKYPITSL